MALTNDLEDWLTKEGHEVVVKRASGVELSSIESLLYEFWLLDTQTRNGGVSQYFWNCPQNWAKCKSLATLNGLTAFDPFATKLDSMIKGAKDPYLRLVRLRHQPDELYDQQVAFFVAELKQIVERERT